VSFLCRISFFFLFFFGLFFTFWGFFFPFYYLCLL
jgi:hypothetical protein